MKPPVLFALALALFVSCLCGCIGLYDDVSAFVDKSRCNLRVGILSDTHYDSPQSDKALAKAFRHFSEREVDAVVMAGDLTKNGNLAQRRGLQKIWDSVFSRGDTRLIAVTGECDKGPSTVFSQEVKGYSFIGANWKSETGVDAWALKPFLAKADRSKPFFYIQNLVPYATCCPNEGRPDVYDNGKVSRMLSKFPNAVAICGRSHTPLTDEAAFWHGDFTCVNAGAFSYAKMRGSENLVKKDVRHGLLMSVYDSCIVFERLDFGQKDEKGPRTGIHVEKLGADWKVTLPAKPSKRPETNAPQFWDDTRLLVFPSEKVVSVRFPPVLAKHTGVRAYAYEVSVKGSDGAALASITTWSPGFCFSEERETKPVTVNFPRSGMPKGRVRFDVTPMDAFGKRGRTLTGEAAL